MAHRIGVFDYCTAITGGPIVVKQVLISANDSLNYDNLTYDNIFNAIKKFDASMCNHKKLLTYQIGRAHV